MNFDQLFRRAVDHRAEHDCSAYPYESYNKLYEIVTKQKPLRILEIGTGIGFTACVMSAAAPSAKIISLDKDTVHAQTSKDFIVSASKMVPQITPANIQIINQIAEQYLPAELETYDLIFFDGYQIHYEFLPQYERLLHTGGILVLGNTHLSSKTSEQFFQELDNPSKWRIMDRFADTIVVQKV